MCRPQTNAFLFFAFFSSRNNVDYFFSSVRPNREKRVFGQLYYFVVEDIFCEAIWSTILNLISIHCDTNSDVRQSLNVDFKYKNTCCQLRSELGMLSSTQYIAFCYANCPFPRYFDAPHYVREKSTLQYCQLISLSSDGIDLLAFVVYTLPIYIQYSLGTPLLCFFLSVFRVSLMLYFECISLFESEALLNL